MSIKNLCSIRLEKNGAKRMRLGGCLYRIRQTNLDRKRGQIHQNASGSENGFGRQVDPQVDTMVDLVPGRSTLWSTPRSTWSWAGNFPPVRSGIWIRILSCFELENIWKLRRVITWSYELRFSKTRTRSQAKFRGECNGITRFPWFLF